MTKEKILLYGIGSLGEKIYEYNKRDGLYEIVAFVDDKEGIDTTFCGLPVVNFATCKDLYPKCEYKVFVSIGYVRCSYYRELVCNKVLADGYELINYISPKSFCWDETIFGRNVFVADNCFIGHGSKVHDGVIVYENCTLSHDTELKEYCFLSLRVAFGGYSKVGEHSFIGLNSTVKDGVKIGAYNIVGCGANVIKSTEDKMVTIGNPGVSKVKDTINMSI